MKKSFFSLHDIEAQGSLKSAGKNWSAVCPECGKRHLSINKANGLYHCFSPDCNCNGILSDFLSHTNSYSVSSMPLHPKQVNKIGDGELEKGSESVSMIPSDYKRLTDKMLIGLTPITKNDETNEYMVPDTIVPYLDSIGITADTAYAMHLCASRHRCYGSDDKNGRDCNCLVYVNYINGKPVNAKYRAVDGKLFSQDSPTTPCPPYNIDCINPLLVAEDYIEKLIVVEGEKDALTIRQAGYPYVVSIANGAATDVKKCFEAFEPWLDAVQNIVICGDSDLPGRALQKHLIDYFGAKSHTVLIPNGCKDISEVLQSYGIACVREVIDNAKPAYTNDIITIDAIAPAVVRRLHGDYDKGYNLGYGPLTDSVLHLNDQGGLIIVTGKPNAGKTDFLNDVCAHMIFKCQKRVCMCSFEVPDKAAHTSKFIQLCTGRSDLSIYSDDDFTPMLNYLNKYFCHIDTDSIDPTPENIIRRAEFIHHQNALHVLVVDPYMFLNTGSSTNETMAIKRMLTQFQLWGRKNKVWVIIVAHPRKLNKVSGSNELEKIDMYTIAGSANWANLADFVISISRIQGQENITTPPIDYTKVDVLKVRDQDLCKAGSVLYCRQKCGRYDERPDKETIEAELCGKPQTKDHEPWATYLTL